MNTQIQQSGAQGPGNYEAAKEWHRLEQEKFDKTGGIAHDQLTVRDWFASQALMGALASGNAASFAGLAKYAYEIADAMIAARKA